MGDAKRRELVLGLIILVAGIAYLFLASRLQLPNRQHVYVNAAFVPYVLGSIMCILGVLQLIAARSPAPASPEPGEQVDYRTVVKTVGLVVSYVALLEYVGFPLMTVLYLVAQFSVLTPVSKRVNYVLYAVIAVISTAVIFLTFRYAFDMMLPVGPFDL
jgi:putative tricarboxylic transport membrane protein